MCYVLIANHYIIHIVSYKNGTKKKQNLFICEHDNVRTTFFLCFLLQRNFIHMKINSLNNADFVRENQINDNIFNIIIL